MRVGSGKLAIQPVSRITTLAEICTDLVHMNI